MTVNRSKTSPGWMGRRAVDIARSACALLLSHLVIAAFLTSAGPVNAGTLLPNGEQQFTDNNGLPLSAGCVFFYVPGTTTPKATYQNSAQTVANTNPVQLDAAGRAIIYGTGTYRQIVRASNGTGTPCSPSGVQIWDQLTASTDSSSTIFAGASAGTPNAITVNAPAFSGADGQVINYISTNTNTGGATLNPSGFGNVPIVRDSATGPGALTGGELVATNAVSVIYDATAGTFHILSPITWPNTSGVPVGAIIPVAGFNAPTNYAFAYGQAVSRTTFSSLMSALTSVQTASLSLGSPIITGLSDTSQFAYLQAIEAVGIPSGTKILSCTASSCTLSKNATATRTGSVMVFPYGNGDGSTTFNIPDYRGVGLAGRDNMGGSPANVLQVSTTMNTTNGSPTATVASAANIAAGMSVLNPNVPSGIFVSSIAGTTVTLSGNASATQSNVATRFSSLNDAQGLGVAGGSFAKALQSVELASNIPDSRTWGFTPTSGTATIYVGSVPPVATNLGGGAAATVPNIYTAITPGGSVAVTGGQINPNGGQVFQHIGPTRIVNYAVRLTP